MRLNPRAMSVSLGDNTPLASSFDNDNEKNTIADSGNIKVVQSTTRMINDTEAPSADRFNRRALTAGVLATTSVGYMQNLNEFLQKPVEIGSGVFNTSQLIASHINSWDLPDVMFAKAIYMNKIKGFMGITGTIVLRLQVNAQPFQAGRLMLHYVPQGQQDPVTSAWRVDNLMRATQTPNVQVDIATQHECVLRIPYVSPTTYYDIITGDGPWGKAWLTVYAPMKVGSGQDGSCGWILWAYFEDVELIVPTIEPQVDNTRPTKTSSTKRRANRFAEMATAAEAEEEDAATKPISHGLKMAADVATVLGKIPMISSFAEPASWVLDTAAGVASAFGYSKPQHTIPATKMVQRTLPYAQNCDGPDTSENMGISAENKVELMPFAGTDRDEMTIAHFCSIRAYYDRVTWAESDLKDTLLISRSCEPHVYRSTIAYNSQVYAAMTPMSLMSSLFEYWRGSIVLTLKAIKTRFHTGRLMVAYVPWHSSTPPTMTAALTDYCFRDVIDLEDSNEWTIALPWTSVQQWHRCGGVGLNDHQTPYDPYGYWYIYVLTPLKTTSVASTTVDIMIEVAASEDMEFACPKPNVVCPISHTEEPTFEFELQVDDQERGDKVNDAIASSQVIPESVDPSRYTIGERIVSINQLLKKQCRVVIPGLSTSANGYAFDVFAVGCTAFDGSTFTQQGMSGDYYSIFGSCFLYRRGSVRFRVYTLTTDRTWAKLIYPIAATNMVEASAPDSNRGGSDTMFAEDTNGVVDCLVPMYSRFHANYNWCQNGLTPTIKYNNTSRLQICSQSSATTRNWSTQRYFRSVGDDFQLGFFIGVPPMNLGPV